MAKPKSKRWTVYCHKNKINSKLYFGITCQTMAERCKSNGSGYKKCPRFWNAIKKYGWSAFEHIIIATNLSEIEAKEMQIYLIAKHQTTSDKYGYNITLGGDGVSGVTITQQMKESTREANSKPVCQFDLDMNLLARYRSAVEAERASGVLHSNIAACCLHRNGHFTSGGYIWLYEAEAGNTNKEDVLFRVKHKRSTPVLQFTTEMEFIKEFPSVQEAATGSGVSASRIRRCAGETNGYPAGGYLWVCKKDYLKMLSGEIPMRKPYTNQHWRAIKQFTKDMKLVGEYESIKSAAEQIGASAQSIIDACRGRHKTAHGYIWRYEEEI